jgi:hypothetical protein
MVFWHWASFGPYCPLSFARGMHVTEFLKIFCSNSNFQNLLCRFQVNKYLQANPPSGGCTGGNTENGTEVWPEKRIKIMKWWPNLSLTTTQLHWSTTLSDLPVLTICWEWGKRQSWRLTWSNDSYISLLQYNTDLGHIYYRKVLLISLRQQTIFRGLKHS